MSAEDSKSSLVEADNSASEKSKSLKERFEEADAHLKVLRESGERNSGEILKILSSYLKLANEGYAPAQVKWAEVMWERKPKEAFNMLDKACDQCYPPAFNCKAFAYYNGTYGLVKSNTEAINLYKLGADLDDPDATYNLALVYIAGEGCKRNHRKAADLLRELTGVPGEKDADVCYQLGKLCLEGKLGRSDKVRVEGMTMMQEAMGRGHEAAHKFNMI